MKYPPFVWAAVIALSKDENETVRRHALGILSKLKPCKHDNMAVEQGGEVYCKECGAHLNE